MSRRHNKHNRRTRNEAKARRDRKRTQCKAAASRLVGALRKMAKWPVPDVSARSYIMPDFEGWRAAIRQAQSLAQRSDLPRKLKVALANTAADADGTLDMIEAAGRLADKPLRGTGSVRASGKGKRPPDLVLDEAGDLVVADAAAQDLQARIERRLLSISGSRLVTLSTPHYGTYPVSRIWGSR